LWNNHFRSPTIKYKQNIFKHKSMTLSRCILTLLLSTTCFGSSYEPSSGWLLFLSKVKYTINNANCVFYLTKKQYSTWRWLITTAETSHWNVRIHLNKIINWVVFDYILFIFYNFIEHNEDISPRSPFLHTHFICLMINTAYFISEMF
jgi:hypothetical protein